MKKVITTYLDNMENEIEEKTKGFPNSRVEFAWNIGNAVAIIIETGEEIKVEEPITPLVAETFSISTVDKLPTFAKAKEKTFYILDAVSGEDAPGTIWVKGSETLCPVTTIDVLVENSTN